MPNITEASWAAEERWLKVNRLIFIPQPGDTTDLTFAYTSTNATDTTIAPPVGDLVTNVGAGSLSGVIQLAISETDRNATDQSASLALIIPGTRLRVTQNIDRTFTATVTAATDMGTWWQFDVELQSATGSFANNSDLEMVAFLNPESLPNGDDTLQIRMAQEWPWVIYRTFGAGDVIPRGRGVIPISDIRVIEIE